MFGVDASVGVVTSAVSAGDSPPDSCFVSFTSSCWSKRNLWMIEPNVFSLFLLIFLYKERKKSEGGDDRTECVFSLSLSLFLQYSDTKKERKNEGEGGSKNRAIDWVISFVSNIRTSP